jgi:hypothetical protein
MIRDRPVRTLQFNKFPPARLVATHLQLPEKNGRCIVIHMVLSVLSEGRGRVDIENPGIVRIGKRVINVGEQ